MLHTKFHENQPTGSGEEDFWRFLPYMGHGGHLGHVTRIMLTNFHFLGDLKAFIQNFVQNGPVVSEKIWFEFLYVHNLGPRSRNDLDLKYSHTFMKSISCPYLPTFRSQASIVSEKSNVFNFSYRKA